MTTVSFPASIVEAKPLTEMVKTIRTEVQARDMVDNLESTWTGQCSILAANEMSGKSYDTFDDAAKAVDVVLKRLREETIKAITSDEEKANKTYAGPDLAEALARLTKEKASVYNNLTSMKSVLLNSLKRGNDILKVVDDGGHILFRKDGSPRAKTELQNLIKKAKDLGKIPLSDIEKAMQRGVAFARSLAVLDQSDRARVLSEMQAKLSELDESSDDYEDEDDSLAEAA
jgi:hypothetical protein